MNEHAMPLMNHLRELKKRTIVSAIGAIFFMIPAYFLYDVIIDLLSMPFINLEGKSLSDRLFVTSLFEGFSTKLKFSFILGLLLSSPLHVFNMIKFIFPGLKTKEKRLVILAVFFSFILALFSLYFGYFIMLPISVTFLTSHQFIPDNVGVLLNYKQNIFYIFNILLYGLITFQFPIILEILLYLDLVSRRKLFQSSRYVIVGIFILSAIITPPDIISQLSLSLPLIGLYFLTLLIAKCFRWGDPECLA